VGSIQSSPSQLSASSLTWLALDNSPLRPPICEDPRPHAWSICASCCVLYFPVTCKPSRAVKSPNIGVPHYIGVPHLPIPSQCSPFELVLVRQQVALFPVDIEPVQSCRPALRLNVQGLEFRGSLGLRFFFWIIGCKVLG